MAIEVVANLLVWPSLVTRCPATTRGFDALKPSTDRNYMHVGSQSALLCSLLVGPASPSRRDIFISYMDSGFKMAIAGVVCELHGSFA